MSAVLMNLIALKTVTVSTLKAAINVYVRQVMRNYSTTVSLNVWVSFMNINYIIFSENLLRVSYEKAGAI